MPRPLPTLAFACLLLALVPTDARAGASCVWKAGFEPGALEGSVSAWAGRHGLGPVSGVHVRVSGGEARLDVATSRAPLVVTIRLGRDCSTAPDVRFEPAGALAVEAGADLVQALPLGRVSIAAAVAPEAPPGAGDPLSLATRGLAIGLVLLLALLRLRGAGVSTGSPLRPAGVDLLVLAGLAVVAAWPILSDPFDGCAPVLRALYARYDVFGDWNHPFLPYLLNLPVARVTLEPWALRLVPLAFVIGETLALALLATRVAGRTAGVLAAAWFVAEIRRRHGIVDLGDWDVAGLFLLAWLGLALRREDLSAARGRASTVMLALLVLAGVFSSWLMIVPAAVLVGLAWLDVVRGRVPALEAAVATGALAGLAALAATVFQAGTRPGLGDPGFTTGLAASMAAELPSGRTLWMLLPLAAGAAWLATTWRRSSTRLIVGTLVAVPSAIFVAWRFSHVNGGYYVGLVVPIAIFAAAVGTARALEAVAGRASARVRRFLPGVLLAGLTLVTVDLPPFVPVSGGAEHLGAFDAVARTDGLPILTDGICVASLLVYERARENGADLAAMLHDGSGTDLGDRVRRLDEDCVPAGGWGAVGPAFHLVTYGIPGRATPPCLAGLVERCRPTFVDNPGRAVRYRFYRCGEP